MEKFAIRIIDLYQNFLSPDHSFWAKLRFPYGYCRFHPTCSEYAKQSLAKYGLVRGIKRSFWRILRCNPFSGGGEDLP